LESKGGTCPALLVFPAGYNAHVNGVLPKEALPSGVIVELVKGDITSDDSEAIVNAANAQLLHGAGVAGAIVRAGGPVIQEESDAWVRTHGPVSHAHPAWTSGGKMSARFVIHAVGPVWGEGDEDRKLSAAVGGSLEAADRLHLESIAFPAISTGIFGFPKERAACVILSAIAAYFAERPSGIRRVRIVLFDEPTIRAFRGAWDDGGW
jgi:O-acetyl-ADP-ribose deacetylase (regulator of RNase III)